MRSAKKCTEKVAQVRPRWGTTNHITTWRLLRKEEEVEGEEEMVVVVVVSKSGVMG